MKIKGVTEGVCEEGKAWMRMQVQEVWERDG
jgi:hypothetical protein